MISDQTVHFLILKSENREGKIHQIYKVYFSYKVYCYVTNILARTSGYPLSTIARNGHNQTSSGITINQSKSNLINFN